MAKIVVTGGAGFIGRSVVKKLLEKNHKVTVVDNLSKTTSFAAKNVNLLKLDLTNPKGVETAFRNAEFVVHLAARIGGIGYFHKYPATILSDNNKILSTVFDASVSAKVKRVVYVSSSMVYESATKFPTVEKDIERIPSPVTSYGFSKLIGEKYCHAYRDQYGLEYTIIRPFNAYGPGESAEDEVGMSHVIPDLVAKVAKGQYPVEILGDGKQVRCFTHVEDIARAIQMSVESKKASDQDFNIANPKPIKIVDLLESIWQIWGEKKKLRVKKVSAFKHDVSVRIPSVKKAEKLLKFKAEIDLETGLKEVISWYKENYEKR